MASRKTQPAEARLSSDSLDLSKILWQNNSDSILSASITLLSLTDSTHSLRSAPSFPSTSSRPVFIDISCGNALLDGSPIANLNATSTTPTVPRMRCMLTEPVTVAQWVEGIVTSSPPDHKPWESAASDVDALRKTWVAKGSFFSPDRFKSRPVSDKRRIQPSESWTMVMQDTTEHSASVDCGSGATSICGGIEATGKVFATIDGSANADAVPTIMLSTSTADMPLSLESNQSVSRVAPAPLAARRGCVGPPSLPLPSLPPSDDLYPGIPTPFGGSPSAYSPRFEFCESEGDFSMDLEAMCRDLRSRCPPLTPPSPIITTDAHFPSTVSPLFDSSMTSDSDEWGFARDLLQAHIEYPAPSSSTGHTPMNLTSGDLLGDTTIDTPSIHNVADISWSTEPTLTNSPQSNYQPEPEAALVGDEEDKPAKTVSELPKQQRRRTVIIETPRSSTAGIARPVRMTIDLSHLAEDEDSVNATEPAMAEIPFDSQPQAFSHTLVMAPSTPTSYARPISSASMGRPVRSILKTREKKSVRFSELPSMHEYTVEERELESVFEVDEREEDVDEGDTKSTRRKRAATTLSTKARRKSSKAESNSGGDDKSVRASFPKHPAIRNLARPGTPTASHYSSLTPAGYVNKPGRRSMLVDCTTGKTDMGRPKRLTGVPMTRSSLPADSGKSLRKKESQDENSGRRSSAVEKSQSSSVQKSRMPFKSILTKLRS